MSVSCLDDLQTLIKPKISNNKIKNKQTNGKENIKKNKNKIK